MSDTGTCRSAIEQRFQQVDIAGIQDERARECVRVLLNPVEKLNEQLPSAQSANAYLLE